MSALSQRDPIWMQPTVKRDSMRSAAATTTEERFSDAGQVHRLTGVCPTVALHVLWDLPAGLQSTDDSKKFAGRHGVLPGSINPHLFTSSRTKNISTVRSAIPTPQFASARCCTQGQHRDCPTPEQPRPVPAVCGRLKLPWDREYPATQGLVCEWAQRIPWSVISRATTSH